MSHRKHPIECPACGAKVPYKAKACPECGSDDKTGWSTDADSWTPDIPVGYENEDDFDYDDFVKREFSRKGTYLRIVAIVVIVVLLAYLLVRF
jgi:hypothetical protein